MIGEHQDAVMAEDELRRVTGLTRSQAAALAAGQLIERRARRSGNSGVRSPRLGHALMRQAGEPGKWP